MNNVEDSKINPSSIKYWNEINTVEPYYLLVVSEIKQVGSKLKVLVEEHSVQPSTDELRKLKKDLNWPGTGEISSINYNGGKLFEIIWDEVIAYSVIEESYALTDKAKIIAGKNLCYAENSNITEVSRSDGIYNHSFNDKEGWGENITKYMQLFTANHFINVAASKPPTIQISNKAIVSKKPWWKFWS